MKRIFLVRHAEAKSAGQGIEDIERALTDDGKKDVSYIAEEFKKEFKEPEIILDLGLFLVKSGMADIKSLIVKDGFYTYDVSLSYPMSGLYNYFLIKELGVAKYLNLVPSK